jgi:hypothetical protein
MKEANPCRAVRRGTNLRLCQPPAMIARRFAETPLQRNSLSWDKVGWSEFRHFPPDKNLRPPLTRLGGASFPSLTKRKTFPDRLLLYGP